MEDYQVRIEFIITSKQLNSEDITKVIQIEPTKTWNYGDFIQNTLLKRKHHGWVLSSLSNNAGFEKQICDILIKLLPYEKKINLLCDEYKVECEFSCCINTLTTGIPSVHLNSHLIKQISRLGADIDIDII